MLGLEEITIPIDTKTIEGYNVLLKCKGLPKYRVEGNNFITDPLSHSYVFGADYERQTLKVSIENAYDYQNFIVNQALYWERYAVFADCGLGKMLIGLMWAKAVSEKGKVLFCAPLSVLPEFINDYKKFGFDFPITNLRETNGEWKEGIGIINYESIHRVNSKDLQGIWLDESSILKNSKGKTSKALTEFARNIRYRLCTSATPSPNDRSEYACHSVFLGYDATVKEFYARFFRKDGNDWVMKGHAENDFYAYLKSWACYIHNPELLGFECGGRLDHEPEYIKEVFKNPKHLQGFKLFTTEVSNSEATKIYRSRWEQGERFDFCISKAREYKKSILWCNRNEQETQFCKVLGRDGLVTGAMIPENRLKVIEAFRGGNLSPLISKPMILGWGVNLQQTEAMIYQGYDYSFEKFYQAVRRGHRNGRIGRMKVYLPAFECELPIIDTLFRKMKTFDKDVIALQERFFD